MNLPPIPPLATHLRAELQLKIDQKTKPLGSLGRLEELALRLGLMQATPSPALGRGIVLVFAADHGLAHEGVSPCPQEITAQMVLNFLKGGAAINAFARQHGLDLWVVDAGVAADFEPRPGLVREHKIGRGTRNALHGPAMGLDEARAALAAGEALAGAYSAEGYDAFLPGEMGIGNTSPSALLCSVLLDLPLEACVGRGAGHDEEGLRRKREVLARTRARHAAAREPLEALAAFGGYEIAMMAGCMIGAAARRRLVVVDGFIATAAAVVAERLRPGVLDYCVFSHASAEGGHAHAVRALGVRPLVDLDLRLGEGTGAVLVWPLLVSATVFLRDMETFASAGVSLNN